MNKKGIVLITALLFWAFNVTQVFASVHTDRFEALNNYLQSTLKKAHIPGASLEIVDKENVLLQNTYGNCKSIKDLFIIGSMSKSFTAMAIMQLVEQNRIELDKPISEYLPEASADREITVRQLLNQTSGIRKYATVANYKVTAEQGNHVYANANYGLLGKIIEKVAGCSYADYIDDHIFIPIGMNRSYTSLNKAEKNGLIEGYRNYFGLTVKERLPYPAAESSGWLTVPAGYIISSAPDMGKYLQTYLNGGNDIISSESIDTMFYNKVEVIKDVYYGMGWGSLSNYSEPVIYHGGLVENYSSVMYLLPESGIGLCLLINTDDYLVGNNIMNKAFLDILDILFGDEPDQIKGSAYWTKHLWIDGIYLIIAVLSLLPLLCIRKWKRRWENSKSWKWLICFTGIHVIIPSGILLLPLIINVPVKVIKGFVPDLFMIFILSLVLFYGTGILKLVLKVKGRS